MAGPNLGFDLDEFLSDALKHYGVKGMKWGVRKDKGHEGEQVSIKKLNRLDRKFERSANTMKVDLKLHNRAAQLTNSVDINRINNKPQYKNADFTKDSPLRQKYYKEHQDAFTANLKKAASELGTNASGTKQYDIITNEVGDWEVTLKDVKHADNDVMTVKVSRDARGHITSLSIVKPDELKQAEDFAEDFLEELRHYGVLGMKWGKRKDRGSKGPAVERRPKSADYKEAVELKKKRPSELSNAELRRLNDRMNLEQNYSRLMANNPSKFSKGAKITQDILKTAGQAYNTYNSPLVKELRKSLTNLS